jgi:hypothetical protein
MNTEPRRFTQVTAFLDANGHIHLYGGGGIIDMNRLDGRERSAALDQLRCAIDADYNRQLAGVSDEQ